MSFGFPRPNFIQPQKTSPKVLLVPVSFSDLKFTDPENELAQEISDTKRFYADNSWGRVSLQFTILPKEFNVKIDSTFSDYRSSFNSDLDKIIESILRRVQSSEITKYDAVVLTTPRSNTITWGGGNGQADLIQTSYGAVGNYYLYVGGNRKLDLSHILGHLLYALTDLYMSSQSIAESAKAPTDLLFYDLMANALSKDFTGWARWLNGWMLENEVSCRDKELKNEIVHLNFLENSTGIKLVIIPLGESKVLMFEYREASESGYCCGNFTQNGKGLLVYQFDGNVRQGFGQMKSYQSPRLLVNNEAAIFEGYSVEVLGVDSKGMYVRLNRN